MKVFLANCYPNMFKLLKLDCHDEPDCLYGATEAPHPLLNGVYRGPVDSANLSAIVTEVCRYFEQKQLPHSWWADTETEPAGLAAELASRKMQCLGRFPAMELNVHTFRVNNTSNDVEIIQVSTDKQMEEWTRVAGTVFGFTDEVRKIFEQRFFNPNKDAPLVHYLALKNGVGVATGSLLKSDDGAYVFNIATLDQERRKGYATALSSRLIADGIAAGAARVGLVASPEGTVFWERLGFETGGCYHIYA